MKLLEYIKRGYMIPDFFFFFFKGEYSFNTIIKCMRKYEK